MARLEFPEGFVWGVATSAQQIEGGRHESGRGESIWDRFAATPGKIEDASNPDLACDHFHRWREDLQLLRELGVGAYRFSIAWPRIAPMGKAKPHAPGLDFYDALVDALLEAGIEPFPTLNHWDLPQALQDRGGWTSRESIESFVDYTEAVCRRLGDRVPRWVTHNEPWCVATLGYEEGHHAPGHKDGAEALRVAHHLLVSHGRAAEVIRGLVKDPEVGIALIHVPVHAASDSKADQDAARWLDGFFNRWYLDPLFRGSYPEDAIADRMKLGHLSSAELPFVKPGDMDHIAAPLDFLGINYYSRSLVEAGPDGRPKAIQNVSSEELTDMGWEVYPEGLEEGLLSLHREYQPKALMVTENGAAYTDPADEEGRIADARRIHFLRSHLVAAHRAIERGVPLHGYFAWSLMDNFEWAHGFAKRFGLYSVDPESLDRSPKDSANWYREVVSNNAVVELPAVESQGEPRVLES